MYFAAIDFVNKLNRLVLSEIASQKYVRFNCFNIMVYLVLIFGVIVDNLIQESNLLDKIIIPLLIFYIVYYIQFVISVTNTLANILNIRIFMVKQKSKNQ